MAAWLVAIVGVAAVTFLLLRDEETASSTDTTGKVTPRTARKTPQPLPESAPRTPAQPAPRPSPEAEFQVRARAADIRKLLRDPDLPDAVTSALLEARVSEVAVALERRAATGDASSNVTLARLHRFCAEGPGFDDSLPEDDPVSAEASEALTRRGRDFAASLRSACGRATFAEGAIEQRLRQAANDGHAASLYVLGTRARDLGSRRKLWMSAAMLGDLQAQMNLVSLLTAESVSAGRGRSEGANFWLAVAANRSPAAQASLAQCRVSGCDGQPADVVVARDHLRTAAKQGDATALESLYRASTAARFEMPADEVYAWANFHRRLLEHGCYGALDYAKREKASGQGLARLGTQLSPFALENGKTLAGEYWKEFGAEARRAQRCN